MSEDGDTTTSGPERRKVLAQTEVIEAEAAVIRAEMRYRNVRFRWLSILAAGAALTTLVVIWGWWPVG